MIKTLRVEEDIHLKRFTSLPSSQKPRFPWRELVLDDLLVQPGVKVEVGGQDRDFDIAEVAETVGSALTDLKLARQEASDIFSEINRNLVTNVAKAVAATLTQRLRAGSDLRLSATDIYHLIEKELIAHDAHEVARSLVYKRSRGENSHSPFSTETHTVRLLRRNGQIVPWSETKIETAVRKAFLSVSHDSDHAIPVAHAVSGRVRACGQAIVNIEDVQDMVQEELMRQGHFKVAEAYILYRAQRAARRKEEEAATAATATANAQESMIVVKRDNGETFFWDGLDLRRRIAYASIGLDLCLSSEEIEKDLRRSLFAEISLGDLKKTIILNAKALIERDADFAKFAGRILLTYIYEEVLGWDIVRDGVEALREAHQKAFKKYLQRGVKIGRISPALLEFDLRAVSEALDPSADLEFDYLGIQTLYDRYLIIDKTAAPHRRLETPQFFWMRVAMGLFIQEKQGRDQWAVRLYQLYKSRRFCSST